jgi:hypothetical protein
MAETDMSVRRDVGGLEHGTNNIMGDVKVITVYTHTFMLTLEKVTSKETEIFTKTAVRNRNSNLACLRYIPVMPW